MAKDYVIEKEKPDFEVRTDLALEERESFPGDGGEISGVSLREWQDKENRVKLTEVKILDERGAAAMGKPLGTYLTLEADQLAGKDEDYHEEVSQELAGHIQKLIMSMMEREKAVVRTEAERMWGKEKKKTGAGKEKPEESLREGAGPKKSRERPKKGAGPEESKESEKKPPQGGAGKELRVLVVGLGNPSVTPDALGPKVIANLQVTRHLEQQYGSGFCKERGLPVISGIVPGVMAQTGMETAEILKGIIRETSPDLLIAVDALAARSIRRLGTTIQLTDTGIHPGSGVGNHRHSLTRESLGIPVLAIGVPTVVGAAAIVHDTVNTMIETLSSSMATKGMGDFIQEMSSDEQYDLIRELLEPEFGSLYVTPPNIDETVSCLSFTISEGIHQAVFEVVKA